MLEKGIIALALLGFAGAAIARPAALSERQAKELAKALDGKAPGEPVTCVSRMLSTDGLRAVTDDLLLYRVNRNLTYRNDLSGSCSGISRGSTLVLKPTNDQYCRGDIAYAIDLSTGMRGASCVLGSFVPYRTAGK
ncbi:hypothetical protein BH10PSE13_BH10PSE13_14470 [soil metagenome]